MWMVREAEADRLSNEEFKKEPNRAAWVGPKLQFNEICRSLQVAQCLDFVVKNKSEEARPRPSRPIRHTRRVAEQEHPLWRLAGDHADVSYRLTFLHRGHGADIQDHAARRRMRFPHGLAEQIGDIADFHA